MFKLLIPTALYLSLRHALAAALLVILVLPATKANASHYRFPVEGMLTGGEVKALNKADIDTTLALLHASAGLKERHQLSQSSGLSFGRLTTLALQSDLLRIVGVGPSMVKLLQSAGIRYSGDLRLASPQPLLERLRAANGIHHVAPVLPQAAVLEDWIAQARALAPMIEGVK